MTMYLLGDLGVEILGEDELKREVEIDEIDIVGFQIEAKGGRKTGQSQW